jgi:hypothetical protein
MAVETTREFFLTRDGRICDNPRVGADLARAYWQPGNRHSFLEFIPLLTGRELGAQALARRVSLDVEERVAAARRSFEKARSRPPAACAPELDAKLRIVHGRETVAELRGDFESFAAEFARWIATLERAG